MLGEGEPFVVQETQFFLEGLHKHAVEFPRLYEAYLAFYWKFCRDPRGLGPICKISPNPKNREFRITKQAPLVAACPGFRILYEVTTPINRVIPHHFCVL